MPRKAYTPANPRPNLFELGYEAVAKILHGRMRGKRVTFLCFVLPTGTTYLRRTKESRLPGPPQSAWVGTYDKNTPVHLIEDDLIDRLRELTAARSKAA